MLVGRPEMRTSPLSATARPKLERSRWWRVGMDERSEHSANGSETVFRAIIVDLTHTARNSNSTCRCCNRRRSRSGFSASPQSPGRLPQTDIITADAVAHSPGHTRKRARFYGALTAGGTMVIRRADPTLLSTINIRARVDSEWRYPTSRSSLQPTPEPRVRAAMEPPSKQMP